jgi:hypothetical protein
MMLIVENVCVEANQVRLQYIVSVVLGCTFTIFYLPVVKLITKKGC